MVFAKRIEVAEGQEKAREGQEEARRERVEVGKGLKNVVESYRGIY